MNIRPNEGNLRWWQLGVLAGVLLLWHLLSRNEQTAFFIGEPMRARAAIPLAVAFTGVFLVIRGHASPGEMVGFGTWEVLGLTSAVLSGAAVMLAPFVWMIATS